MPARSAARLSWPGSTGLARYDHNPGVNESLKTGTPVPVCSVKYGLLPHWETQSCPGSLRAEPQQIELAPSESLRSLSSVAVGGTAVSSIAKRTARDGRLHPVPS